MALGLQACRWRAIEKPRVRARRRARELMAAGTRRYAEDTRRAGVLPLPPLRGAYHRGQRGQGILSVANERAARVAAAVTGDYARSRVPSAGNRRSRVGLQNRADSRSHWQPIKIGAERRRRAGRPGRVAATDITPRRIPALAHTRPVAGVSVNDPPCGHQMPRAFYGHLTARAQSIDVRGPPSPSRWSDRGGSTRRP